MEHDYGRDLCIHGYYIYEAIGQAVVGENLACKREPRNIHDRYAVAVKKGCNCPSAIYQEIFLNFAHCSRKEEAAYTVLSLGCKVTGPTYHKPQTALTC